MSPRGFAAVEAYAEKISRSSFDGDSIPILYFKLPNNKDSATVRFLEQGDDVYSFYFHDFSHINPSQGWKTKVPCLDQEDKGAPCPGCENDLPRKFQGLINIIWRDAPVFKRDEDGKLVRDASDNIIVTGTKDQVAVWRGGIELFSKVLRRKDVTYKGLGTRDFEVTREGVKLDTTYSVEPADPDAGAKKMTKADQDLAKDKYDLEEVARFVEADKFEEIIAEKMEGVEEEEEDLTRFMKDSPYSEIDPNE